MSKFTTMSLVGLVVFIIALVLINILPNPYPSKTSPTQSEPNNTCYASGYEIDHPVWYSEGYENVYEVSEPSDYNYIDEETSLHISDDLSLSSAYEKITYSISGQVLSDLFYSVDSDGNQTELKQIVFQYNDNDQLISKSYYYHGKEDAEKRESWSFDVHGNLTRHIVGDTVKSEWENTYDADGNCLCKSQIGGVNQIEYQYKDGILTSTYESYDASWEYDTDYGWIEVPAISYDYIEFDLDGRPVKEKLLESGEPPAIIEYTYSSSCNITCYNDLMGRLKTKITETYDSDGRKLSWLREEYDNSLVLKRRVMEERLYEGNTITTRYFENDDNLVKYIICDFNDASLLISETTYDGLGNNVSCRRYYYDSRGYVISLEKETQGESVVLYGPERTYYENGAVKEIILAPDVDYIVPSLFISSRDIAYYTSH